MGSPGSPVYDTIGVDYTVNRRTDPRWQALLGAHLGNVRRLVNVGAGTGSYEPAAAVATVAVEPSAVMVAQRPPGAAPAVRAAAAALPLRSGSLDAAMAILTVHHWDDWRGGLAELRRVAGRRLILTIDFPVHAAFWLLAEYLPEVADHERSLRPSPEDIAAELPLTEVVPLPLPADMSDGVLGAHWRRPAAYLDPVVRANCSPLALADPVPLTVGLRRLERDLASGAWQRRHADLLEAETHDLGYRLLVSAEA